MIVGNQSSTVVHLCLLIYRRPCRSTATGPFFVPGTQRLTPQSLSLGLVKLPIGAQGAPWKAAATDARSLTTGGWSQLGGACQGVSSNAKRADADETRFGASCPLLPVADRCGGGSDVDVG